MEYERFEAIRNLFCQRHEGVTQGKMMHSPAIHYHNKVFAFFSRSKKMVFKLGKDYPLDGSDVEISAFNPFKNKGPLAGWYEVDHRFQDAWEELTATALEAIKAK